MGNSNTKAEDVCCAPEMQSALMEETKNLIQRIRDDIHQKKEISEGTRKNCQSILDRAERDYTNYLIIFLEETQILINNARQKPLSGRAPIGKAWKHAFEIYVQQCKTIIGPILHVINVLIADNEALKQKYGGQLAGGIVLAIIGGGVSYSAYAHICQTTCACACFVCTPIGLLCLISGVGVATIAAVFLLCCAVETKKIKKIYEICIKEVQLAFTTVLPNFFNDSQKPITADQLEKLLADTINILKVTDEIWNNDTKLETLNRLAEANLNLLRKKS